MDDGDIISGARYSSRNLEYDKQTDELVKEIEEGKYSLPLDVEYRFYKVKEMDIKFKLEQKKLMQEEKKKMLERKRQEKEIRLKIQ